MQSGDTLAKIAKQKGFDLDQMKAANPELTDYDRLTPNQVIKLPGKRKEPFPRNPCLPWWNYNVGTSISAREYIPL